MRHQTPHSRIGLWLGIVAVIAALFTAGSGIVALASSSTPSLTDSQKLDKILANTEEIKKKLGITPTVPVPTFPPSTATSTLPPVTYPPSPTTTKTTTKTATKTTTPTTTVTTTVRTTTPTSSAAPPPPAGGTAAAAFGWGTPIPEASDEFNGTSIDGSKWGGPDVGECWEANDTVKKGRCGDHNAIGGGTFKEHGSTDGKTGYLSSSKGYKYGRWEVRLRITRTGSGSEFHPNLLLWPDSDKWPSGGECDYMEINGADTHAEAFMHHPDGSQDEFKSTQAVDFGQWHNFAFEWTSGHLRGFIDGAQWFDDAKSSAQPPGPMHGTIQLDNFVGSGMKDTIMEADWFHVYHV